MKALARTIWLFWTTSLLAELEYRTNFAFSLLTSALNLVASLFTLSLFFRYDAELGGWSWGEAVMVLGTFTILQGFSATLLQPNLNRIVEHVRQGTLDFVLLKPIDTQLWLSLRRVSPWGLPDVLLGVGIVVYGAALGDVTWRGAIMGLGCLACSLVILYALWFMMAATTVWFVQIYNVTELLRALLDAGRFPIDAFPRGAYRFVFTFVVPVAFMTTVPVRALLGDASGPGLLAAFGLAATLAWAARALLHYALRDYTSASS